MFTTPKRWRAPRAPLSLLLTVLLSAQAGAQSPTKPRPDPLDPKAEVPSVRYESTFSGFRRIGDDKPVTWREANDTVTRIGGWRVYTREAQQPDPVAVDKPAAPAQPPATAPAPMPAPAGHSGHRH